VDLGHRLVLDLAGPLRLRDADGVDLTPRGRKAQGLLALLGTAPSLKRSRSWLQDKLWSDRGPKQGAGSLRQCLAEIRRGLGPRTHCLRTAGGWVALDPAWVEVRTAPSPNSRGSETEFLEGLDVRDPEFENWLRDQRLAHLDDDPAPEHDPGSVVLCSGPPTLAVLAVSEPEAAVTNGLSAFVAELTHHLARRPDVQVIACLPGLRPEPGAGVREMARWLGARHLVLCRMTDCMAQSGLMVQLVEGASAAVRWSERYPLSASSSAAIRARSAAVAGVLAGLDGEIVRVERARLRHDAGASGDPYELYVLAGDGLETNDREAALAATALAERCTAIDPRFARGWLLLNWCRHRLYCYGWGEDGPDRLRREEAVFRKAVELEPRDPVALGYLAVARAKSGALSEARRLVEHAEELAADQPDLAVELSFPMSAIAGQPERALRLIARARDRDPASRSHWGFMEARAAFLAGRHEWAVAAADLSPDCLPKLVFKTLAATELGDAAEAMRGWEALRAQIPTFDFSRYARDLPIADAGALATYRAAQARFHALLGGVNTGFARVNA
jgi:hypothetical protein